MVLETLIKELNFNVDVSGYIIEGYPRTQRQIEDFEKYVSAEYVLLDRFAIDGDDLPSRSV